jgi:hypothetical protein
MRVVHVLRKPCSEGTVAANVLRHGTGAIHIDATRIPSFDGHLTARTPAPPRAGAVRFGHGRPMGGIGSPHGRWPANMVLDADAALPELAESTRYFLRVGRS